MIKKYINGDATRIILFLTTLLSNAVGGTAAALSRAVENELKSVFCDIFHKAIEPNLSRSATNGPRQQESQLSLEKVVVSNYTRGENQLTINFKADDLDVGHIILSVGSSAGPKVTSILWTKPCYLALKSSTGNQWQMQTSMSSAATEIQIQDDLNKMMQVVQKLGLIDLETTNNTALSNIHVLKFLSSSDIGAVHNVNKATFATKEDFRALLSQWEKEYGLSVKISTELLDLMKKCDISPIKCVQHLSAKFAQDAVPPESRSEYVQNYMRKLILWKQVELARSKIFEKIIKPLLSEENRLTVSYPEPPNESYQIRLKKVITIFNQVITSGNALRDRIGINGNGYSFYLRDPGSRYLSFQHSHSGLDIYFKPNNYYEAYDQNKRTVCSFHYSNRDKKLSRISMTWGEPPLGQYMRLNANFGQDAYSLRLKGQEFESMALGSIQNSTDRERLSEILKPLITNLEQIDRSRAEQSNIPDDLVKSLGRYYELET